MRDQHTDGCILFALISVCAVVKHLITHNWSSMADNPITQGGIVLVIRWAGIGYGLYLVEELIHGEAAGRTVYDVSKIRYNPYPTTQRT